MLLIGSQALVNMGRTDLIDRKPADTDLIASPDELRGMVAALRDDDEVAAVYPIAAGKKTIIRTKTLGIVEVEVEVAWDGTTAAELLAMDDGLEPCGLFCGRLFVTIPWVVTLYSLKMSHRYLKDSPHFDKTRQDILRMRRAGAVIPDGLREWFKRREKETYNYSHPKFF